LDELQAALLNVKLSHLDEINNERERICERYIRYLDCCAIDCPRICEKSTSAWHQFVIRAKRRNDLINYHEQRRLRRIFAARTFEHTPDASFFD
jgi:dTDP-4-amino-4,6-dideoxygalactose transaminase